MSLNFKTKLIRFLYFWFVPIWLQGKTQIKNQYAFDDLSPIDNIENGTVYCESLEWALSNKDVKNIAVTGPYGSGKSSVLRTFQKLHPAYNYLNISLASFRNGNNMETGGELANPGNIDEHRLVEISILQQIFYKEKAWVIPDSRFKRIRSLRWYKLLPYTVLFTAVILALMYLFGGTMSEKLGIPKSSIENSVVQYIAAAILMTGLIVVVRYLVRFFNAKQFGKLNISSGEIAIESDNEKSILNKHLDEILYFFEVTRYNVVIIEDLDRFKNHEIFTKLRELNILINSSRQINRRIVFIYAIKDDMFQDKTRTKFFDFIIPVIPVINWSNSLSIMLKKLQQPELGIQVEENFIRDITLFIDDMRILKNIFNEFMIYKENLKSLTINQNKLLGLIIYKNIYPEDFSDLHENMGIIYEAINKLPELKAKQMVNINKDIAELTNNINGASSLFQESLEELRAIYILKIAQQIEGSTAIQLNNNRMPLASVLEESQFNILKATKNISLYTSNNYSQNPLNKSFKEIEKLVNPYETYDQRARLLEMKTADKIQLLKSRLDLLQQQKNEILSYSLKEFLANYPEAVDSFNENLRGKQLLVYLLRFGYIDEMYSALTSYFYEGGVSKNDMDFLLNLKEQRNTEFKFQLNKTGEIMKSIRTLELRTEPALNFSLCTYILRNRISYSLHYQTLFSAFQQKKPRFLEFMFAYIEEGEEPGLFVAALCEHWKGFWISLNSDNTLQDEKLRKILRLIIRDAELKHIAELNEKNHLSEYINDFEGFLDLLPDPVHTGKLKSVIRQLGIKFRALQLPQQESELFTYIYSNNFYELNPAMIDLVIKTKSPTPDMANIYRNAPYSGVLNSGCPELVQYVNKEINKFIIGAFLVPEGSTMESEESFKKLLNNENITLENKSKIIEKQDQLITDISYVPAETWPSLIRYQKIETNWENLLLYFQEKKELDEVLVEFLNEPDNYTQLAGMELNSELKGADGNPLDDKLSRALIEVVGITDSSFEKLVKSIVYEYKENEIKFSAIPGQRIRLLILEKKLTLSPAAFNQLKTQEKHPILFLAANSRGFIRRQQEFNLSSAEYCALLDCKELPSIDKPPIIENISENLITGNDNLADIICAVWVTNKIQVTNFEKLKTVIMFCRDSSNKIKVLNNQLNLLSKEQIENLLVVSGEPYAGIAERGKRPTIEINQENAELAEKLQLVGFISSYNMDSQQGTIRLYTRQPD